VTQCESDQPCITACQRQFFIDIEKCPCYSYCPLGCRDCGHWSCRNHILTLFTSSSFSKEVIFFDTTGNSDVLDSFSFGQETIVYHSCSVVNDGKMTIFGGSSGYRRQISIVDDCNLKSIGTLPFNFELGACNIRSGEEVTYLCFAEGNYKNCRSTIQSVRSYVHQHGKSCRLFSDYQWKWSSYS